MVGKLEVYSKDVKATNELIVAPVNREVIAAALRAYSSCGAVQVVSESFYEIHR